MVEVLFRGKTDFSDAAEIITFDIIGRELSCYFYRVDQQPPASIGRLREFFDIWNNARNAALPSWKDFSFEEFLGWHSVMRVMNTGGKLEADKTNVIMGDTFSSYWGTKTFKAQIDEGVITGNHIMKSHQKYHTLLYSGYYVFNVCTFPGLESSENSMVMIDLPLSDDGTNVSHIIGAFITSE